MKVAGGTNTLAYSSPVAGRRHRRRVRRGGRDAASERHDAGAPTTATSRPSRPAIRTVTWRERQTAELWDGSRWPAGQYVGTGSLARNGLTALQGAGGSATPTPASLYYGAREYKDFELSVDYRAAATNSNGGVLLRFPKPATVADADRNGYQVAILDNGTAATRTGAILQERARARVRPTRPRRTSSPRASGTRSTISAIGRHITVARSTARQVQPVHRHARPPRRATSASRTRAPA